MGRGAEESGGRQKASLLGNSVEALIGAIYLDQGIKATELFIKREFSSLIEKLVKEPKVKDYKSTLQEKLQAQTKVAPSYKTLKAVGPPHNRIFTIGVYLRKKLIAHGRGSSKQEGEQKAARAALEKLKKG
jgi:ribonuclease-3